MLDLTVIWSALVTGQAQGGVNAIHEGEGLKYTYLGMSVVFSGLLTLCLVLYLLGYIIGNKNKILSSFKPKSEEKPDEKKPLTGEEATAISLAIILYHRMHMEDRRQKLTMRSELKMLSPWALSGKIRRTQFSKLK